jgi:hypothetical protein
MVNAIEQGQKIARKKGYTKSWDINICIVQEIERVCRVSNRDLTDGTHSIVDLLAAGYRVAVSQDVKG